MHETTQLRAARQAAGWSQARLIAAMRSSAPYFRMTLPGDESLKTNIKRWEGGRVAPGPEYKRLFQHVYGLTADQLGFAASAADSTLEYRGAQPAQLSGEVLAYYAVLLEEHVKADNLLGPRYVLDVVRHQTATLATAAKEARGKSRPAVVGMAARYHEFYGWLLQDAGLHRDAATSTLRAKELAVELSDPSLNAYLLMRRSNVASDGGNAALAASLADAALSEFGAVLSAKSRAVVLRQKANAYAALGQADQCAAAVEDAFDAADELARDERELAGYCTSAYIGMEAGTCWLTLGQPERALEAFSRADPVWDPAMRRDQGLALARLASAYAGAGQPRDAVRAAAEALSIVALTRSARTQRELRLLLPKLAQWADDDVHAIRQAIEGLTAA